MYLEIETMGFFADTEIYKHQQRGSPAIAVSVVFDLS